MDNKYTRNLVKAAQNKNRNSYFKLCELNIGSVYTLSLRLLADHETACSITKSVFLIAWKDIINLREEDSFQNWLRGITIYKCLEAIRNDVQKFREQNDFVQVVKEGSEMTSPLDLKFLKAELFDRLLLIFNDVEGYSVKESFELLMGFEIKKEEETVISARKKLLGIKSRTCNQNDIRMDYYVRNLLSEVQKIKVENHLLKCKNCYLEMNKLREYYTELNDLPVSIEPPVSLFNEISNEILELSAYTTKERNTLISNESYASLKKEKKERKKKEAEVHKKIIEIVKKKKSGKSIDFDKISEFLTDRRTVYVLAFIVFLLISTFLYNYFQNGSSWKVKAVKGKYAVLPVNQQLNEIKVKQKVKTFDNAEVEISIHENGRIFLFSNSGLSVIENSMGEKIAQLDIGVAQIQLFTKNSFLLKTKNYEIKGGRTTYKCYIDDMNNFKIIVNNGFVELTGKGTTFKVIKDYLYEVKFGAMKNIPVSSKASDKFKLAFDNYLYKNGGEDALNMILYESREFDAITLWHLIYIIPKNRIIDLYNRIRDFYTIPMGISKNDILTLQPDKMKFLLSEMERKLLNN